MRFSSILIASTLISCYFFKKEELERLFKLEEIYGKMPTNKKERVSFAKSIDSTMGNLSLENSELFNKFAPFLLHSVNYNYMLKDMDLRLVYESNNENIKNDWKNHAVQKVGSLRFSFNIDKLNDDDLSKEIKFCKNFSKITKVELRYGSTAFFDQSKTWSNSMEVLSKRKEIPGCTELELCFFNLDILKDFIDGVAASNPEVQMNFKKLKIVFKNESGIRSLNSAVGKFSSLVTSLKNLSEITIENQATTYTPGEGHESDNLVKLIEGLPEKITINLIGRFFESNQKRKFVNALKEEKKFVDALKKRSHTGKVSIVYKPNSFDKFNALWLRDTMKDSKLDISILDISNGIKRPIEIPSSIAFSDNLLKAKYFSIGFVSKEIEFDHTNMNDFLSSFGPFFQEREWEWVIYRDKKPRTEICELPEFVKAFNKCKLVKFNSNFLDISNENDTNDFISEVNKRDKRLLLYASEILIDSENLIKIYNKMQEKENFTVKAKSWLIRVRKGKVGAFKDKFEEIYKTLYPEGLYQNEFLDKIEALSKLSELDVFTINLSNKDVLYIGDKEFDNVLKVLPTIKNMFEKVIVAKKAFTVVQIYKLRTQLGNGGSCTLEKGTEESLLNPWLTSKNYLIRLFLWLKTIFRCYS
ncbi:hypothetical protein GINT2_000684 [Glugoides intestinalis]